MELKFQQAQTSLNLNRSLPEDCCKGFQNILVKFKSSVINSISYIVHQTITCKLLVIHATIRRERIAAGFSADYENFKRFCVELSTRDMLICRQVWINMQDEVLAVIILINDGGRLYNIVKTLSHQPVVK